MDWWLCPWRILETVTGSLETFSIQKEKMFQPRIQYWHKTQWKFDGTPDTIYHIISQWYLSQAFWEPDVQVCIIYTFEVYRTVYDHIINNI
jgi:hypothetical protein